MQQRQRTMAEKGIGSNFIQLSELDVRLPGEQ
jgi:hypothetical protein